VLGNSTSHGLHLIAGGLRWADGDEVLVIEGDYPATVLPWLRLAADGVRVRPLRPAGGLLSGAELAAAIGPRTRLLAVTWTDSFTAGCRRRQVTRRCRGRRGRSAQPRRRRQAERC
jgi:cysteine desulfurase / selenocysteine lyase